MSKVDATVYERLRVLSQLYHEGQTLPLKITFSVGEVVAIFAELDANRTRITEMQQAVQEHMGKEGHDLCWENDQELWSKILGPDARRYPHASLPSQEEFLRACTRYYEGRCPLDKKSEG